MGEFNLVGNSHSIFRSLNSLWNVSGYLAAIMLRTADDCVAQLCVPMSRFSPLHLIVIQSSGTKYLRPQTAVHHGQLAAPHVPQEGRGRRHPQRVARLHVGRPPRRVTRRLRLLLLLICGMNKDSGCLNCWLSIRLCRRGDVALSSRRRTFSV